MIWRKKEFKAKVVPRGTAKTAGYPFFLLRSQEVTTAFRRELRLLIPTDWSAQHGTLCVCWGDKEYAVEHLMTRSLRKEYPNAPSGCAATRTDPLGATQSFCVGDLDSSYPSVRTLWIRYRCHPDPDPSLLISTPILMIIFFIPYSLFSTL
jgi:hypothetical protein